MVFISLYRFLKPRYLLSLSEQFFVPCQTFCVSTSSVKSEKVSNQNEEYSHVPVMLKEVIEALDPQDNKVYLDMTFGGGGHSRELLDSALIKLYCLDRDPVAYEKAVSLSQSHKSRMIPLLGRFSELATLLEKQGIPENSFDGILFDVGCSSMQLDDPVRGFSISKNGPLDMRMDSTRYQKQPTAADILNHLDVPSLAKIFKVYGEEKHAKKIAQALFDARYMLKSINTTHELSDLIYSVIGSDQRTDKLQRPVHVATKVFQALRIFVNNELNELNYGIKLAHAYLKPEGRLVALTFHSLEDRIVKRHILGIDMDEPISHSISQKYKNAATWHQKEDVENIYNKKWTPMYKTVLTPSPEEVLLNPRSRSAKLRAAFKN